jgi:hypothetical protein
MAAIGVTIAFKAALGRIGFNAATQDAIVENGFNSIDDLGTTDEKSLNYLPKHLATWRDPAAPAADQVRVPFVAMEKLKAMRYWVLAQTRIGAPTTAVFFTNAVVASTLQTMKVARDQKEATEDTEVQKPVVLSDMHKWTKFWLMLSTYLGRIRGAAHIPLSYLTREHVAVTPEIETAAYATPEDKLIAITLHSGEHYLVDNKTLYEELKPLVVDGPGWGFIKKFDKAKDGRGAIMALKAQAEGQSAKLTQKTTAYAAMASASFRGQRRGYTFDNYVSIHQEAHNELLDLEEEVPESKKVTDFLRGIQDPVLLLGKSIILGDPLKMGNFEQCQQYLGTLLQNTGAQAKAERNVSSVHANGEGGGSNGGSALVDKIKGGSYSPAQWNDLSQAEKDRIAKYRDEAKEKKKMKSKARARKRKLAKAQSNRDNDSEGGNNESATPSNSNAGSQFGSNGSSKKQKS